MILRVKSTRRQRRCHLFLRRIVKKSYLPLKSAYISPIYSEGVFCQEKIMNSHKAPMIGIATISVEEQNYPPLNGVRNTYIDCIVNAGGVPILIPQLGNNPEYLRAILAKCQGLLLCGGRDINPLRYGAARHPTTEVSDDRRDESELQLIKLARDWKMPILGICRGCQLINVAFGGTLFQDLPSEAPQMAYHGKKESAVMNIDKRHGVAISAGTRLAAMYGKELSVNSIHHQGIRDLGKGLRAAAISEDGLIESVEADESFVLGVQWHPEIMWHNDKEHQKPFEVFVEESARFRAMSA